MARTVYLHIGMPKAASTSIQNALNGYSDERIAYAALGSANHSRLLHEVFTERPEPGDWRRRQGRSKDWIADARRKQSAVFDEAVRRDDRDLILSGELLCNLKDDELQALKDRLTPTFDRFKVIGYARRPVEFASSLFQQRMKNRKSDFFISPPDYRRFFNGFITIFGREAVSIKLLRPEALTGGDVIVDFCDQVGIDGASLKGTRHNESFCAEVVAMLYAWNRHGFDYVGDPDQSGASRSFIKELQGVKGTKFRLSNDIVVGRVNRDAVTWLETTFDMDCREPHDPGPDSTVIGSEEALLALAEHATPRLDGILDKRGLSPAQDASAVVKLNAIYADFLVERLQARGRTPEAKHVAHSDAIADA